MEPGPSAKTPRIPQREPGRIRFKKLLEAFDQLLVEKPVQEVGLYDISKRAKVPPASVYHFFPGKEAALIALARVHHEALEEISFTKPQTPPSSWQELSRHKVEETARYYNQNPSAMRLFFGSNISAEVRNADVGQYARLVEGRRDILALYFKISSVDNLDQRLFTYYGIIDGVFSLAYAREGQISDEYVRESHTAGIAYLRCFLPEQLSRAKY